MREEHNIFCGGIGKTGDASGKALELKLGERICLDVDAITKKMVEDLPSRMRDLLEIATYVYVADQAISRGGLKEFEYGQKWNRSLNFKIPVREYDVWAATEMRELLENTLSFASGDTYTFEFFDQQSDKFPGFLNFKAETEPPRDYNEVLLFSGGLDSFTGIVDEVVSQGNHPVLVSHQSNNKIISLQRTLSDYLVQLCGPGSKILHVPVIINKDKSLTQETSQRSRSFLYASLGTIVAHMFKLNRVRFYENGIVSCNLPFDGQTLQARATRSTHPKLLSLLSHVMSELLDLDFVFENPYFHKTKTEVCLRLLELQHQREIRNTRSCAKSVYKKPQTHCGVCSQCIDRKFATLASQCGEYDPDYLYLLDIFTGNLDKIHDRAMAAGFVNFTTDIENMTADGFVRKFSSDVHEILRFMEGQNTEEKLTQLFDLHHRHAKSVNAVMDAKCRENVTSARKSKLPQTCLVNMVFRGEHRDIEKLIKSDSDKALELPGKKNRPTAAEMKNRNRIVAMAAAEIKIKYDRLATVSEIIEKTKLTAEEVYATSPYKEGKIAKKSAKLTTESTGSSVTNSEQFEEKSVAHSRAKRRSKSDQAELETLIDKQKEDDSRKFAN